MPDVCSANRPYQSKNRHWQSMLIYQVSSSRRLALCANILTKCYTVCHKFRYCEKLPCWLEAMGLQNNGFDIEKHKPNATYVKHKSKKFLLSGYSLRFNLTDKNTPFKPQITTATNGETSLLLLATKQHQIPCTACLSTAVSITSLSIGLPLQKRGATCRICWQSEFMQC